MLAQFSDPYDVAESAFALRASVGLTVSPLHGTDPEQLVQHAEVARGVALRSRSGLEIYSAERNDFTERRLAVLRGLGPALRRREMTVHFQPQVQVATGQVSGYEALLRWHHPVLGRSRRTSSWRSPSTPDDARGHRLRPRRGAAPGRRVAAAGLDRDGLGERLGERPAGPGAAGARRPAAWRCGACRAPRSSWSSRDGGHVPPAALPGGHARAAQPARRPVARRLRHGYASLAYLTTMPSTSSRSTSRSCSAWPPTGRPGRGPLDPRAGPLARAAGRREGVETKECAELLASWGCPTAQGWHFGRPVPAQDVVLDLTVPRATAVAGTTT
jgi:hypothetical protein